MANNETVRIQIAEVGAQQATKDVKSLSAQIKELRNQLGNLQQGTDEYNATLMQMSDLMQRQREISEQAAAVNQDYGATLSNLTKVASGVVGSITAVQGALNLVGAGNEDTMKVVKTMTSLMGILQGLSAIDEARKSFDGLWKRIKLTATATKEENVSMKVNTVEAGKNAAAMTTAAAATKAEGVAAASASKSVNLLSLGFTKLKAAIKSFMTSNPFTLILLGLTTVITLMDNWISKTKEEQAEMKKAGEEARNAAMESNLAYTTSNTGQTTLNETEKIAKGKQMANSRNLANVTDTFNFEDTDKMARFAVITSELKQELEDLKRTEGEFSEEYEKKYLIFMARQQQMIKAELNWAQQMIDSENSVIRAWEGKNDEYVESSKAHIEKLEKAIAGFYVQMYDLETTAVNYLDGFEKAKEEKRKKGVSDAEQAMQKELAKINQKYELQKKIEENAYNNQEKTTKEHWERELKIEGDYWDEISKKYERYVKKGLMTQQQYELYTQQHVANVISLNKSLSQELISIWEKTDNPEVSKRIKELEDETKRAEELARRRNEDTQVDFGGDNYLEKQLEFQEGYLQTKLRMIQEAEDQQYEIEYQSNQKHLELQLERQKMDLEMLEQQKNLAIDNDTENTNFEIEKLRQQYESKLIAEEEYQQKRTELELQHEQTKQQLKNQYIQDRADAEYELAQTIYQLHENEYNHEVEMFQRKQQLTKSYLSSFTTMVGGVQGLLSELQGSYEEGSKEYENIERANIILSGITGALQAWQSGMAAAPAPWNLAIAAAMAGISTATTIVALANLKNKKLSTSASQASLNITPYETVATETGAELNGQIADTRVIVVESDIEDVARRVYIAESEASF